jgi:hypothetical protein
MSDVDTIARKPSVSAGEPPRSASTMVERIYKALELGQRDRRLRELVRGSA